MLTQTPLPPQDIKAVSEEREVFEKREGCEAESPEEAMRGATRVRAKPATERKQFRPPMRRALSTARAGVANQPVATTVWLAAETPTCRSSSPAQPCASYTPRNRVLRGDGCGD
jgi:hypothetical protein